MLWFFLIEITSTSPLLLNANRQYNRQFYPLYLLVTEVSEKFTISRTEIFNAAVNALIFHRYNSSARCILVINMVDCGETNKKTISKEIEALSP